jgi:hypothetical protein
VTRYAPYDACNGIANLAAHLHFGARWTDDAKELSSHGCNQKVVGPVLKEAEPLEKLRDLRIHAHALSWKK